MKLISPKYIITVNPLREILTNHSVLIDGNYIRKIELTEVLKSEVQNEICDIVDVPDLILIPGFVQTHIHLCQTLFRGLADDLELLDWLQYKIFPFEAAHSKESMRASAQLGLVELVRSGTTTILDMGSINHSDIVFEELQKFGIRAFHGKAMMDINNIFPKLSEKMSDAIESSQQLAKAFHNSSNGRIKYAFAPRFLLSCSDELLKGSNNLVHDFSESLFHTHASENQSELEAVRQRCGRNNIEHFEEIQVLNDRSCIAHCIWLNDNEVNLMKNRKSRVLHCPSSNLKLASGIANIPRYLKEGINVSLGADGAPCNNFLDIFVEMRLASLIQKPIHGPKVMNAKTVFELATIEGAKALHLENKIGSIEEGKKADLVLLDLNKIHNSLSDAKEDLYSKIVFSCDHSNVHSVMVEGEWIYSNKSFVKYDEKEIVSNAKFELSKLINRVS
ncbi:MAG: 5'-deoxyadenosine deaminase [Bacteroidetes bacterium]|nr:5'-deoxyadenosine deaminase [Bacteroidota bacterium]